MNFAGGEAPRASIDPAAAEEDDGLALVHGQALACVRLQVPAAVSPRGRKSHVLGPVGWLRSFVRLHVTRRIAEPPPLPRQRPPLFGELQPLHP